MKYLEWAVPPPKEVSIWDLYHGQAVLNKGQAALETWSSHVELSGTWRAGKMGVGQ